MSPPLVPEIKLHLAHEAVPLWEKTEEELGELGLAWPFGPLPRPADRPWRVMCWIIPTGLKTFAFLIWRPVPGWWRSPPCGLVPLRLRQRIDEFATTAAGMNARLNQVRLEIKLADILIQQPPSTDVILVGDLFYEKTLAARCLAWLRQAQGQSVKIFIGDPGRSSCRGTSWKNLPRITFR